MLFISKIFSTTQMLVYVVEFDFQMETQHSHKTIHI